MSRRAPYSVIVVAALAAVLATGAAIGAGAPPEVEIFGFMDILYTADNDDPSVGDFALDQAEIAIAAGTSPYTLFSVAVAYDAEAETWGLGAGGMDLRLFGPADSHLWGSSLFHQSGVIIGQFDVVFGVDWIVYPAIDRQLVSAPLVVTGTHDQWNDKGLMLYGVTDHLDVTAWLTNGFTREGVDGLGGAVSADAARGGGARVAWMVNGDLEIGGSAARVGGVDPDRYQGLLGCDLQAAVGPFVFKGEYISHRVHYAADLSPTNHGWYAQGQYRTGPWTVVGRWDRFDAEETDVDSAKRVCVGGGREIAGCMFLRGEYQVGVGDGAEDTWVLQLAAGF